MPYYDYKCPICSGICEVLHSMKEEPIIECGQCKIAMSPVIHAAKILFVGGGWTTPGLHTTVGT